MKYFIVYPDGYDPIVASGPPTKWYADLGVGWDASATQAQKELSKQIKIIAAENPPVGVYSQEVNKEAYDKYYFKMSPHLKERLSALRSDVKDSEVIILMKNIKDQFPNTITLQKEGREFLIQALDNYMKEFK